MFMKMTKCTEVVKVIGKYVINDTLQKLRTNTFSTIIVETTDVSTRKSYAVIEKYLVPEWNIKMSVIDLVDLYTGQEEGRICIQRL